MPIITLPDNSTRSIDQPISIQEFTNSIGSGLAKAALAAKINDNKLVDLSYVINQNIKLAIITDKDPEGLEILRHSCAHLLAHAVKQLFPNVQVTIGPTIENGFYYDFAASPAFTPEDLERIEKRMQELAKQNIPIERKVMSRDEAIALFKSLGENYKIEIIQAIPENQEISLYQQGDFIDICRGPHLPNTNKIKAFKLTKLAGAYWRGDSKNATLQRIYGTAFANTDALKNYLTQLEEAKKRDHRKLGQQLDLFHIQEEAPGMIFWHDKGWRIFQNIITYVRKLLRENNYQEISAPLILDRSLWEKSGHWEKFGEGGMFITSSENRTYVVKPMNCPGHIQIFNQGVKSYRDLPIRLAEFGLCHRNEPSGTLHGLMRVREFTQDDAHVFCTEDQVPKEIIKLINLIFNAYQYFGFEDILIRLATRPEKRIGSDAVWDRAEKVLENALHQENLKFELAEGEGAFYGPKIEFHLRDCIGRLWQCGTIQLDFSMPERLGAEYIKEDGSKATPVMIHRVIIGSIDRFVGILIEHYAGKFPLWLAPVQIAILTITDAQHDYAKEIAEKLNKAGFYMVTDLRNEKIGFKIREHTLQKIPYLIILGDQECETRTIAVRTQSGEDLGKMPLDKFLALLTSLLKR